MPAIHALLQELEQEAETTRRVLERVPNDRLAWKPHAKSMSLGRARAARRNGAGDGRHHRRAA